MVTLAKGVFGQTFLPECKVEKIRPNPIFVSKNFAKTFFSGPIRNSKFKLAFCIGTGQVGRKYSNLFLNGIQNFNPKLKL